MASLDDGEPRRSSRIKAAPKSDIQEVVSKSDSHESSDNDGSDSPSKTTKRGKRKVDEDVGEVDSEADVDSDDSAPPKQNRRISRKKSAGDSKAASKQDEETPSPKRRRSSSTAKKTSKSKAKTSDKKGSGDESASATKKKKKKKAPAHQVLTEKSDLPKLWDSSKGSYTLKIASWNVAGLRALLKKFPNVLAELVETHDLDVLCLQETKLQTQHLDDPKLDIPKLEAEGYQAYYSCSTKKKGYSGTAAFVRNKLGKQGKSAGKQATMDQFLGAKKTESASKAASETETTTSSDLPVLQDVSFEMNIEKHDGEGRLILLDFSTFTLCNVYVPNSGQNLARLQYRTEEWDKDFLAFMQSKQKDRGVPIMWIGDLNVAHTKLEVWNEGAKHLPKQAGVTPEERASFQEQLDAGFVDAFRKLHPTASGHYSYWSGRAGNRPVNKGLRLDYFVCDPALFDEESSSAVLVRDSYMLADQEGSDHCPVILELEVRPC